MSLKLHEMPTLDARSDLQVACTSVVGASVNEGSGEDLAGKGGNPPASEGPSLTETLDYVQVLAAQLKKLAHTAGFGRLGLILMMAEQEAQQQMHQSGAHQSGRPTPDGMGSPSGRQD